MKLDSFYPDEEIAGRDCAAVRGASREEDLEQAGTDRAGAGQAGGGGVGYLQAE